MLAKKALTLNAWHHVVVTYDGSRKAAGIKIFVDGVLQSLDVNKDKLKGSIATQHAFHIGKRGNSLPFKGKIDDVRFYRLVISGDEAARLAAGVGPDRIAQILAVPAAKRSDGAASDACGVSISRRSTRKLASRGPNWPWSSSRKAELEKNVSGAAAWSWPTCRRRATPSS